MSQEWVQLTVDDVRWAVERLPDVVRDLLMNHEGIFLAGGFIRATICNEKANDVDIFAKTSTFAHDMAKILSADQRQKIHETENAYTVMVGRIPVQFIHRWTFKEPVDAIASFDFTIAKAALWWTGTRWNSVADPRFYPDLAAKRLVYTSPERQEEAGGSLLRVLKFYQRGYRIRLDSFGTVIARLMSAVREEDLEVFIRASSGTRENAVAKVVTGLLREVDPLFDPNHKFHLPSYDEAFESVMGAELPESA